MTDFLASLENSGFGLWVRESGSLWSYPTIIFLHSLGLSFVVGLNVAMNLRLLGVAARLPLAPRMHRTIIRRMTCVTIR